VAAPPRTIGLLAGPGEHLNWGPRLGGPPNVRGGAYLSDGKKLPSAPPRLACIGVQAIELPLVCGVVCCAHAACWVPPARRT
jgi:hypothetical protein